MSKQYRVEKREQEGSKAPAWDVEVSRDGGATWEWVSRWDRKRDATVAKEFRERAALVGEKGPQ